ncbi:hypothetical protein EFO30_01820 [Lactococcus lactis]|uniref:hypothetical protein n=1 Tax=Lactococcus lactis TaxID=1358 RepID=UPI0021A6EDB0|nr:hypothetical protein [Lactococcus lactis]MCT3084089.1 hypothetical protein [Lactococcus lactis]MCT3121774.1 hypothetical protein [Lactococcus lactis]
MKITIDVLENESNKDNLEYLISDTSNEAMTVLMFALIGETRQRTSYEQFLETITRIWRYLNEDN